VTRAEWIAETIRVAVLARDACDAMQFTREPATAFDERRALHCLAVLVEVGIMNGHVDSRGVMSSPLAQAMIDISQRCYSAEWLNSLAGDLWAMVHAGGAVECYGNEPITEGEIANLRALAAASGCWCDWSEAEGRPVDIPLGEWLGRFWNVKGGAT
jgi:hypothetical protein